MTVVTIHTINQNFRIKKNKLFSNLYKPLFLNIILLSHNSWDTFIHILYNECNYYYGTDIVNIFRFFLNMLMWSKGCFNMLSHFFCNLLPEEKKKTLFSLLSVPFQFHEWSFIFCSIIVHTFSVWNMHANVITIMGQ